MKPCLALSFTLTRKSDWYLINHMFVYFLLSTLSFYTMVIPSEDVADRASVTLTILLTIVA